MKNLEVIQAAILGTLKKIESLEYVVAVERVDNTIVVLNKKGERSTLDMIKGEQGDKGDKGDDYNEEIATSALNLLLEQYKETELAEVQEILGVVNGN